MVHFLILLYFYTFYSILIEFYIVLYSIRYKINIFMLVNKKPTLYIMKLTKSKLLITFGTITTINETLSRHSSNCK